MSVKILGQVNYCNCNANNKQVPDFEVKLRGKAFINKYPGESGQFFGNWTHGELLMSDGSIVKSKILNYNCLLDELIWMRSTDNQQVVLDKNTIKGFVLYDSNNNKIAEFKKLFLKNRTINNYSGTYLQVLAQGKLTLYLERRSVVLNNTLALQRQDKYYLKKDSILYKLTPNRRFLFRLMGEDKAKMKTIVKRNFLFIRNESALIKAVQLFNEENIH